MLNVSRVQLKPPRTKFVRVRSTFAFVHLERFKHRPLSALLAGPRVKSTDRRLLPSPRLRRPGPAWVGLRVFKLGEAEFDGRKVLKLEPKADYTVSKKLIKSVR